MAVVLDAAIEHVAGGRLPDLQYFRVARFPDRLGKELHVFSLTRPTGGVFIAWVLGAELLVAVAAEDAARNVRIVDYGADMCGFVYNPYRDQPASAARSLRPFLDKDRNGTLDNDSVSGWQFSLSEPLNFPYAPHYDLRQKNARLYGGLMIYAVNNAQREVSEGMLNANHELRDDFNFMGLGPNQPIPPEELCEAYAVWFWQKADFLNGGAEHPVWFDAGSFLAVHVSRYWGGLDAGRWVVREGDDFYVSQETFGDLHELLDGRAVLRRHHGRNPLTHRTFVLRPNDSQWAAWHPREADGTRHSVIDFDASAAKFGTHVFRNVTAVGWLATRALSKTTLAVSTGQSPHQAIALKWYAFRCDAVVKRPDRPGHAVPLAPSGERLWLSGAVTFRQWETIRRIGVTNQFCRGLGDLGYAIFHDGAIADMERADRTFHIDEPVAAIAWLDAVAWCNMLSEFEGLRPAYYADRECTRILRRALDRSRVETLGDRPTVYWDRSAAGFRLPTRAEAPGGAAFCWEGPESGAVLCIARNRGPGGDGVVSRLTGSQEFAEPDEPPADLKDRVLAQLHAVRLPVGLATVEDDDPLGVFAARRAVERARNDRFMGRITTEQLDRVIAENPLPDFEQRTPYVLEVGTTEVPYRLWNCVRRWAQTRGYRFNYRGDMGSMRCLFAGAETFSPDHPVTHVSWHDALVWCNALSELTGRRPVYHLDAQRTRPYRRAVTLRLDMVDGESYPVPAEHVRRVLGQEGRISPGQRIDTNSAELVYLDTGADGYRLPLVQEFDRMLAIVRGPALRGQTLAAPERPRTTRSVSQATPDANGLCDLSGGVLEWGWSPLESYLNGLGQYSMNGYGCFSMTEAQTAANRRRYQDLVYNARPYYGVRIVRRAD